MILRSFSWLAVHELIQAAEASVVPVREGVAKPQARSTGSSVSNSIPNPNGGYPGARFRFRPGKSTQCAVWCKTETKLVIVSVVMFLSSLLISSCKTITEDT